MNVKRVAQAVILGCIHNLPRIPGRNGGHKIRVHDAALHRINGGRIKIIPQAVVVKKISRPIQAGRAEDMFAGDALVLEIVQSVTNPRMSHAQVLINLIE